MAQTLEEIRKKGLEALRKELGLAGTVRFLQQFLPGKGDYAKERHAWVDRTTLEDIRRSIDKNRRRQAQRKKGPKKGPS
jgi:hypothetical protein